LPLVCSASPIMSIASTIGISSSAGMPPGTFASVS